MQEVTEAPTALPDLETLYNQGHGSFGAMGDEAPILFLEINIDYLNEFYPGLAAIEMKQFYAGVAPVTNAPFEIILVEVADVADVRTVLEIFHARMDRESDDSTYPENAKAWIKSLYGSSGAINIDLVSALKSYSKEYIFYRTDHHWTSLGAFYGANDILNTMGLEALQLFLFSG